MESKKIVIANLKMNMTFSEVKKYVEKIRDIHTKRVVFCPSALYIPYFLGYDYSVGIQQIANEDYGAYTGQISSLQAKSLGAVLSIIGHSECRLHLNETDDLINGKVKNALKNKLNVILCIGETMEQRDMLRTDRVLRKQISKGLSGLTTSDLQHVYIAYEPIWAIGTGQVPTNRDIKKTIQFIQKQVSKEFRYEDICVLYGGSVNHKNIKSLSTIEECAGFLVGGASLNPKEISKIIEVAVKE